MQPYREYFKGKRVTLMGLGLLGRGVGDARFMAECGAELLITDMKNEEVLASSLEQLKEFTNITYRLGGHDLKDFEDRDLVVKAAGVPLDSPYIAHARKYGVLVRMSADLFAELSGAPIVGVTGTRGKSTVTHLIAHILREAGREVLLGGNVQGVSTLALLPQVTPRAIVALELDSWQLQGWGGASMSPSVSVFTTFMPDHMNYYHDDLRQYFADKANIFLNQKEDDIFILGEQVVRTLEEYGYKNKIQAHTEVAGPKDVPSEVHLSIPGEHNRYNAGLAAAAARALGVDEEMIEAALSSFPGVPGRLELVRTVGGVSYYNDTTATTPDATLVALQAVGDRTHKKIILIMGGSDKGLDMQPCVDAAQVYCKSILLLAGTGTDRIKSELPNTTTYHSMNEAVAAAHALAMPGDIVLLSPAFASFGMFQNEYDRGAKFNAALATLA